MSYIRRYKSASKPALRKLPKAPAMSEALNNCSARYNFLKALLNPEVAINNESCALISDHNIWLSKRRALSGIITEARSLYCKIDESSFVGLRLNYPSPLLHLRYVFYHLLNESTRLCVHGCKICKVALSY